LTSVSWPIFREFGGASGKPKLNTLKFIKSVFAFSINNVCHLWRTVFAANEAGRRPAGGAYNNLQTCKQSTLNVEPFSTVNGYSLF